MGAKGEPPLAAGPAWGVPSPPALRERVSASEVGGFPTAADHSVPGLRQGARGPRGPCSRGRMSGPAFVRSLFKGGKGHQESLDLGPRLGRWNAAAVGSQSASIPACPHRPQVQCAARRFIPGLQSSQQHPHHAVGNLCFPSLGFCSDPFVHHKQAFWVWCEAVRRHCLFYAINLCLMSHIQPAVAFACLFIESLFFIVTFGKS